MPEISVIIPTYNRAAWVTQAVDSVLAQTYRDFEVLVIDDGSTDETQERLRQYSKQVRVYQQNHQGISHARNLGLKKATGRYLAFLDDDDRWLPQKLQTQIDFLKQHPDLSFVCAEMYAINSNGERIAHLRTKKKQPETFDALLQENFIFLQTVLIKAASLQGLNGFDPELPMSADYDLWLRVTKKGKFAYLREPLAEYRWHTANSIKKLDDWLEAHLKIFVKSEVISGVASSQVQLAVAKIYYRFAQYYAKSGFEEKSKDCYRQAIRRQPFIGAYFWPESLEGLRFSLPIRIFYPYAQSWPVRAQRNVF